jgi:hypothetical protein
MLFCIANNENLLKIEGLALLPIMHYHVRLSVFLNFSTLPAQIRNRLYMKASPFYKLIYFDEFSATPKYQQLANSIMKAIEDGKAAGG